MNKDTVTITLNYSEAHELSYLLDTLNNLRFHLHDMDGANLNEHQETLICRLQDAEVVKMIDKVQDDLNSQLDFALSEFRYCLQDLGDLEQVEPTLTNHINILERLIIKRESIEKIAYWIWGLRQLISKYDFGISQRLDDFVGFYQKEVKNVD